MRELLDRFEAENAGITVALDMVPYKAILESLPVQLAAGEGPDLARVTDLGGLNQYYLDLTPYVDAAYWEANFGDTLDWYRAGPDDEGIYGMLTQLTITGPYINRTLFDQAGVAVPARRGRLGEMGRGRAQVAEATGTTFPMAIDRSGHRLAGPAISMGAKLFDAEGKPAVVDEGFRQHRREFVAWHEDGTMAQDVWAGQGGATYRDAAAGVHQRQPGLLLTPAAGRSARFEEAIGDAFDWQVVGAPCGPGGCTGMPGGAGIVGFKETEAPGGGGQGDRLLRARGRPRRADRAHPEHPGAQGARREGARLSRRLAAGRGRAAGLGQAGAEDLAGRLLAAGLRATTARSSTSIVQRVTQAIVGEMTVDEALTRINADVAEAVAQSKQ